MWPFSSKQSFFTQEENDRIVEAIRQAELATSGEIRLFVESRCKYVEPLDRAVEIFTELKMFETSQRNGVLLYLAIRDKQLAIYADKGIHEAAGKDYWPAVVQKIIPEFSANHLTEGIIIAVRDIGTALAIHFPYDASIDKNELPDEMVFGA